MKYKVAAIQFCCETDKETNLFKMEKLLESAGKEGVKLAVLQEYFLTGYASKDDAESIPGEVTNRIGKIAKRCKLYVAAGTMVEKDDNNFYSTLPLIDPNGKVIAKYRKVHLLPSEVKQGITRGKEIVVCKTEIGAIGLLGGVDLDTVITPWIVALKGCDILVAPHMCSSKYVDAHRYLLHAVAWLNMMYVVAPNPVGMFETRGLTSHNLFLGGSRIISPKGELLANAGEFDEGMAIATVDLDMLNEYRESMKEWKKQVVPEAYRPFIDLHI